MVYIRESILKALIIFIAVCLATNVVGEKISNHLQIPANKVSCSVVSRLGLRNNKNSIESETGHGVLLVACAENTLENPKLSGTDDILNRVPQLKQFQSNVLNTFSSVKKVL